MISLPCRSCEFYQKKLESLPTIKQHRNALSELSIKEKELDIEKKRVSALKKIAAEINAELESNREDKLITDLDYETRLVQADIDKEDDRQHIEQLNIKLLEANTLITEGNEYASQLCLEQDRKTASLNKRIQELETRIKSFEAREDQLLQEARHATQEKENAAKKANDTINSMFSRNYVAALRRDMDGIESNLSKQLNWANDKIEELKMQNQAHKDQIKTMYSVEYVNQLIEFHEREKKICKTMHQYSLP